MTCVRRRKCCNIYDNLTENSYIDLINLIFCVQIAMHIIQLILTIGYMLIGALKPTLDQKYTIWSGAFAPPIIIFDVFIYKDMHNAVNSEKVDMWIVAIFTTTIILKNACALFVFYHSFAHNKTLTKYQRQERRNWDETWLFTWHQKTYIYWLITWFFLCIFLTAFSTGFEKNIGEECGVNRVAYAFQVFFSFLVIPTIFTINDNKTLFANCPDAPIFPSVLSYVVSTIALIALLWVLIAVCAGTIECKEPVAVEVPAPRPSAQEIPVAPVDTESVEIQPNEK